MKNNRIPHGQYTRSTPDWFVFNRMSGQEYQGPTAAKFSTVGLYNNATDGSMLHVVGAVATSPGGTGGISAFIHQGIWGALQGQDTTRIIPNLGMLFGAFYNNTTATSFPDPQIWTFAVGTAFAPWPYDFPIAILPPGYTLVCQQNTVNADVSAAFTWLVMGKNEGYF